MLYCEGGLNALLHTPIAGFLQHCRHTLPLAVHRWRLQVLRHNTDGLYENGNLNRRHLFDEVPCTSGTVLVAK
ncbi:hypothetical protein MHYP_G00180720 [Metynnis hypsauchen]